MWERYRPLWPVLNWGLFALGLAFIIGAMTGLVPYGRSPTGMSDGAAWYFVQTPYDWSDRPPGVAEYRYSPAFLTLTAPLRLLSFEAFQVVWVGLHVVAILWLRAPWMMAFPGVIDDTIQGNVNTFFALAAVLALRGHAWTWSFVVLTKVTPGVGALVHVARREWSAAGMAAGVTLAIVVIGVLIQPDLWFDWFRSLTSGYGNAATPYLPVRLAIAAVLCWFAGTRPWLLPVGMLVAMPGIWPASFAVLAAVPVLISPRSAEFAPRHAVTDGEGPQPGTAAP